MTAQLWPFKPRTDIIETLEWSTDVLTTKQGEQRIALRTAPRRIFNYSHVFNEYEYSAALGMINSAQGGDGFLVPDWSQYVSIGPVSSGVGVPLSANLEYVDVQDDAMLWESSSKFEAVTVAADSNAVIDSSGFLDSSGVAFASVTKSYNSALFIPLWAGIAPEGLIASRQPGGIIQANIALETTANSNLSLSLYDQYRGHDIMPSCPVVGGGSLSESAGWEVTRFDNNQSAPYLLRQRDYAVVRFTLSWNEKERADQYSLRQWLHSRRGRQRAFWVSSFNKDFEPVSPSISGTTITVYDLVGMDNLGRTSFDIEVVSANGTSRYRRVTGVTNGSTVNGRTTSVMTIDTGLSIASVQRISLLRCARFDSDSLELRHRAVEGMYLTAPCVEVAVP